MLKEGTKVRILQLLFGLNCNYLKALPRLDERAGTEVDFKIIASSESMRLIHEGISFFIIPPWVAAPSSTILHVIGLGYLCWFQFQYLVLSCHYFPFSS